MTFEVVYNTALKIYSKLYVGCKPRGKNKVPLGFATPYEENAAGLKRQATVQGWVGHSTYDCETRKQVEFAPDLRVVDNVARAGFKITDDVKRVYWGGGNVVWRLEDPLGWEIEIQSSNLMALIQVVGISAGGVIDGECIIARDGAHNVLLPVSSQEYKDAIKAAEGAKAPGKIPMKDRIIGRTYRLQDGTYGTYLGKHWVSSQDYGNDGYHTASNLLIEKDGSRFSVEAQVSSRLFSSISEQYEGLYVPEVVMYPGSSYSYKKHSGQVKYYKSAPLIAELDQAEAITLEAAIELANKTKMVWAGFKNGQPIMAYPANGASLRWTTRKISDDKFKKAKAKTIEDAKMQIETRQQQIEYAARNGTNCEPDPEPTFNIGRMTAQHSDDIYLNVADDLYYGVHVIDLANRGYGYGYGRYDQEPHDYVALASRVIFSRQGQQSIQPKDYHPRAAMGKARTNGTSTIIYEQFDTIELLEAQLNELHELGAFVEKFVTIRDSE